MCPNIEIRDRLELVTYQDLNDLVQICIKVVQQSLKKGLKTSHYSSYVKKDYRVNKSKKNALGT